jgi:hypothetical protein
MYPVIIWIFIAELPNPCKVCLVQVFLEEHKPVVEYWLRVIFVKGYEEADDGLLFVRWKF